MNYNQLRFELEVSVGINLEDFLDRLTEQERDEIQHMEAHEVVEATDFDEPRWDSLFHEA